MKSVVLPAEKPGWSDPLLATQKVSPETVVAKMNSKN